MRTAARAILMGSHMNTSEKGKTDVQSNLAAAADDRRIGERCMIDNRSAKLTLAQALRAASRHWDGRPGGRCMWTFASRCADLAAAHRGGTAATVSAQSLGPADGAAVLGGLRLTLKPASVTAYYSAFRRALALNGILTTNWPAAPRLPRVKRREPLSDDDLNRLAGQLASSGYGETADLVQLLAATGLRIGIEALTHGATSYSDGPEFGVLTVRGKGGHERVLPVIDGEGRAILSDPQRLERIRATRSATHRHRWGVAARALGIASRLPTPHAARHAYATNALRASGGNLALVAELMGHADPKTTAGYIAVDMGEKAAALSKVHKPLGPTEDTPPK